ncbi:MAG: hypothetical protein ABSD98_06185 [Candidatus Korobacteraceae bacterium]|jgi:hypothetical protein
MSSRQKKFHMLNRRRASLRGCIVLSVVLAFTAVFCTAQTNGQQSQKSLSDFFNSIANFTYNMAWPTATYQSWSFDSIRDVPGGYDVVLLLDGRSGWDKSDLWLKLGFAIRSDGVDKVWVVDDNAILVQPFKTMQALGELTADLAKQYQQSQKAQPSSAQPQTASPTTAEALCLSNETSGTLVIKYHWGNDNWSTEMIDANKSTTFWFPTENGATTVPPFFVEYNPSFADPSAMQDYRLEHQAVSLPANCMAAKQYVFSSSGNNIVLQATN